MSVRAKTEGQRLLQAYFAAHPDLTQRALADRVGRSSVQVHKWLFGKNIPDVVSAAKLEEATGGDVSSRAWSYAAGRFPKAA